MRFSLRFLLVMVAVVGVYIVVARDYGRLRNARAEFAFKSAYWEAGRLSFDDYMSASQELWRVEANTLFATKHAASLQHADRMRDLLAKTRSGTFELGSVIQNARVARLEKEIRESDPTWHEDERTAD